jgi:hypothetical protein
MLSILLRLGLLSGLFPSGFPTNNLYLTSLFLLTNTQTPRLLVRKRTIMTADRRRSTNFVLPTFACRGVSRGQRRGSQRPLISGFYTRATTLYFK